MESLDIKQLIGEATEYDKKLSLEAKKPKSWCKSVSAFVNTLGGALIFGIADNDEIVGLENPNSDAEKISEIIKTRMDPIPEFRLRFEQVEDGKVLIILDIFKGEETPYYYSGDGVLEAYVRVGNESVKATSTELKRLVLRGRNTSYDSQISTYKVEDFAFSKLRERYKKWTGNSFDEKDLISFGVANEQGYLTNAGALVADESPIRWSRLFCTRWNGLNKSGGTIDAFDDAEYSGSVLSLIDNGEAFIKRNAKLMWRKTANSREEMPEYVERSYHEALVNALAHRDYQNQGSVYVKHYPDKVVIENPGGFPEGITQNNIITHPSVSRNKLIAETLQRLKYVQRTGQGVDIIYRDMVSSGKPYPEYRSYSDAVSLTMYSGIDDIEFVKFIAEEQNSRQWNSSLAELMILRFLTDNRRISFSEARELLQGTKDITQKSLNSLIKKGLIEISGKKYMLTAKMYQAVKSDIEYMQDKVLQYVKAKGLIMEYMVVL